MSGRPWTEDEDRVILWAARRGIARKLVGRELGRTGAAIRKRQQRLRYKPPHVDLSGPAGFRCHASFTWNAGIAAGRADDRESRFDGVGRAA